MRQSVRQPRRKLFTGVKEQGIELGRRSGRSRCSCPSARPGSSAPGRLPLVGRSLTASAPPVACRRGSPGLAPLVLGGELASTARLRNAVGVSVSAPTRIPLRKEQHVLADRMELLIAERADVGRGLQVLRAAHVPPPKGFLVGHSTASIASVRRVPRRPHGCRHDPDVFAAEDLGDKVRCTCGRGSGSGCGFPRGPGRDGAHLACDLCDGVRELLARAKERLASSSKRRHLQTHD